MEGRSVQGQSADLEGVVEAEFNDFVLQFERLAKGATKLGPVEFPGDAFLGDDGVGLAALRIALANAVQDFAVEANDFVVAAAVPGTGDGIGGRAGDRPQKQLLEGFEVGAEVAEPNGPLGIAAGDGFEGGPEGGWEKGGVVLATHI